MDRKNYIEACTYELKVKFSEESFSILRELYKEAETQLFEHIEKIINPTIKPNLDFVILRIDRNFLKGFELGYGDNLKALISEYNSKKDKFRKFDNNEKFFDVVFNRRKRKIIKVLEGLI